MRIAIYVKNDNLHTGNISLKREHIKGYWDGMVDSIDVFTEDKEFCESYYGSGLQFLMLSLTSMHSNGEEFFLAKRHFMKNPKPAKKKDCDCKGYTRPNHGPVCVCDECM